MQFLAKKIRAFPLFKVIVLHNGYMFYLLRGLAILTSLVTAGEQSPGRESIRYPSFTKNRRVWYGLQRERTTKYLSSFSESVSYTAFQKPVNLERIVPLQKRLRNQYKMKINNNNNKQIKTFT